MTGEPGRLPMLQLLGRRELHLAPAAATTVHAPTDAAAAGALAPGLPPRWLSAASGLVVRGDVAWVVADDETSIARFDLGSQAPGRLLPLFGDDAPLPDTHAERKAAKPDVEALVEWPATDGWLHGGLLALGSASRANRQRAALLPLDAAGGVAGTACTADLAALVEPLRARWPALNLEGAFFDEHHFSLLQRGHARGGENARIAYDRRGFTRWLQAQLPSGVEGRAGGRAAGPAPAPAFVTPYELGALDGVPLSFTDACVLAGGRWAFSAAAEDTADNYEDGRCAGSVVGLVGADGAIERLARIPLVCKVEGIAAVPAGEALDLWLVTDADDRSRPGWLLHARWPGALQPARLGGPPSTRRMRAE